MIHFEYPTTDIVLAASLKMYGCKLDRIHLQDGRRGVFFFRDVEDEFIDMFNTGKVTVEPTAFHSEVRILTGSVNRMKGPQ
jgi:hypothetical protein